MSNYIRDVELTINDKYVWRPARRNDLVYDLVVQFSPTNRARCRKCSQYIQKNEIRCGLPIKHSMGNNGWISAWQHLNCTRLDNVKKTGSNVYGFDTLPHEERELVMKEITSSEVPEHLQSLNPEDLVRRGKLEEVPEPTTLLRPLLPFQREGLGWMIRQEMSDVHGGILADEMGMGKTIQMVSLLLSHRVPGPTLIVCPVSSMLQWQSEINDHVIPNSLSVLVVYKTSKITVEEMERADVVLTTYPMLEQAWRALITRIKVPCPYCGLYFIPRQLVVHNKYFCGPRARRTMKQALREKRKHGATRKVQSEATIRKGLRTLHVNVEDDDHEDINNNVYLNKYHDNTNGSSYKDEANARNEANSTAETKTRSTVMGPMGMYAELMREAGRTIRSRWDAARTTEESSSASSQEEEEQQLSVSEKEQEEEEESADGTSSSSSSAAAASSSSSQASSEYDSAAEELERKQVAKRQSQEKRTLTSFKCAHCGFQLLRFPFCPKTGQHHVLSEEMKHIIESDTGGDQVDLQASPFHSISWARVVLDEAHRIKGRTTSTARSAFALHATYRWCLTGTPLQNRVGDLYSLLRFLRMSPYARYYCGVEGCSCSSLSHPFSGTSLRQCVFCGHGPLQHYAYFNRQILNPINRYGYIGDGRKGMMELSNQVFARAMLRRTKAERASDLHLPPLEIAVRTIHLTEEERNFYESLYKKSTAQFDTFVRKGTVLHNYAHIFQLLSRLRQALDHPLLVVQNMNLGSVVYAKGVCGICGEGIEGESAILVSPCKHCFHRLCLGQFLESAPDQNFHCPTCFVRINVDLRMLRTEMEEDEGVAGPLMPPELEDEMNVTDANENVEEEMKAEAESQKTDPGLNPETDNNNKDDGEDDDNGCDDNITRTNVKENELQQEQLHHHKQHKRTRDKTSKSTLKCKETEVAEQMLLPSSPSSLSAPVRKVDRGILSRIDPNKPLHGTKLDAIAEYITSVPSQDKVIVFSQFGDMLDLTQYWLQRRFVKSVKLCGSLTLSQRQSVLQAFLHDASVRVILISLKAGGEGLNLQVANHVVLIDPWWNPAVELQAVQRAHRIGQTKPVKAIRFETANSVEERMIELQEKKMLVFEGTIDGKMQSLNKLSEQDLQFLFTR